LLAALRAKDNTAAQIKWLDAFEETLDLRGKSLVYAKAHLEGLWNEFGGRGNPPAATTVRARVQRDLGRGAGPADAVDFMAAIDAGDEIEWIENDRTLTIPRVVLKSMADLSMSPRRQMLFEPDGEAEFHQMLVLHTEPTATLVLAQSDANIVHVSVLTKDVVPLLKHDEDEDVGPDAVVVQFGGKPPLPLHACAKPGAPCKLARGDPVNSTHFFAYTKKRCVNIDLWNSLQEVLAGIYTLPSEVREWSVQCLDDTVGRVATAAGDIYGVAVLRQPRRSCRLVVSGTGRVASTLSLDALRHSYQSDSGANEAENDDDVVDCDADRDDMTRLEGCKANFERSLATARRNVPESLNNHPLMAALNGMKSLTPTQVDYFKQLEKVTGAFKQLFGKGKGTSPAPRESLSDANVKLAEWTTALEEVTEKDRKLVEPSGDLEAQIDVLQKSQEEIEKHRQRTLAKVKEMSTFMEMFVARLYAIKADMTTDNAFKDAVNQKQSEHGAIKAEMKALKEQCSIVQQEATERTPPIPDCLAVDTFEYVDQHIGKLFLFTRPGDVFAYDPQRQTSSTTGDTYGDFDDPADVRIAPGGGFALVANGTTVVVIDLQDVCTHGLNGPLHVKDTVRGFADARAVAIDPACTFALVVDSGTKQIFRVEIITNTDDYTGQVRTRSFSSPVLIYNCGGRMPTGVAIEPQSAGSRSGVEFALVAHEQGIDRIALNGVETATLARWFGGSNSAFVPMSIVVHPGGEAAFVSCQTRDGSDKGVVAHLALDTKAHAKMPEHVLSSGFDATMPLADLVANVSGDAAGINPSSAPAPEQRLLWKGQTGWVELPATSRQQAGEYGVKVGDKLTLVEVEEDEMDYTRFVPLLQPKTVAVDADRVYVLEAETLTIATLFEPHPTFAHTGQQRVLDEFALPLEAAALDAHEQTTEMVASLAHLKVQLSANVPPTPRAADAGIAPLTKPAGKKPPAAGKQDRLHTPNKADWR
jgi:DNA-binding beta-propeller fold protein YncE